MIKDFLIINCTGNNDTIGLKINNNFFVHNFQNKIHNNELLVSTILNLTTKHKVNIDKNFTVIGKNGPGNCSSIRDDLSAAKGIEITKKVKLYGIKNEAIPVFYLKNVEKLINKKLIEKKLIKPLYLS